MAQTEISTKRIKYAFIIAVFADGLEYPITWFEHTEWEWVRLSARFADVLLDCAVMWALTEILGFHWVFFPSFCVEAMPEIDMFPSWVACVTYVLWEKKKERQQPPPLRTLPGVQQIEIAAAPTPASGAVPPPILHNASNT